MSVLLLWVFAIALTPFSVFHNHHDDEPQCVPHEKTCTHKIHIGSHKEECLICAAHFEKNYTTTQQYFQVYLVNKAVAQYFVTAGGFYTELIGQSLRGPPLA
ncbi:hypothetical protein Phep_0175 [Pedobacter heparinus DSM 2366]|uniref:Secreted protein n=1 Tax=Pedobacter heparinus (strain ATCC 13125 / DSM 2366 / CIP 104194 / JCM 7457 / NBRC 12017 / NCIMB 9290 / NRRL B-14731 / HIM 762-3) TaxID=485917 RepID=C6XYD4_PEDHD|nr:hypothetical protein Phep_0175 [Pedobacter heparinus DSM 2366]